MRCRFQTRISAIGMCLLACVWLCAASEETWIEIKSPNFTVISNASIRQAQRVAKNLEQFRTAVHVLFPKMKLNPAVPPLVLAARSEKDVKALLPSDRQGKGVAQTAGAFLPGPERNYILLSTDVPEDQGYRVIYHEYTHVLMGLNYRNLPLWLGEGFAELLGSATLSEKESGLGRVRPEVLRTLQTTSMPLSVLMDVTRDSSYYRQQDKMAVFYSWSWALTHYLMLGDNKAHSAQLKEFLRLLEDGAPEQEASRRALGDLKVLERNLERYIRSNRFYYYKIPMPANPGEDRYAAHPISSADSLALRAIFLVHGNRPDDAKAMLNRALKLDPGNAAANEGMELLLKRDHGQTLPAVENKANGN
jgi:hypothetical protein